MQQNKHINQKLHTASIQTFSENASYFNYRISMDTKGPINPPSNQNSYIHVIVDAFSHFVVTVPKKQNNAQNAVNSLLHHWITKFHSSFPYKQKEQIPQNTSLDNQSDIHDYDNFINPRRHSYNRYNFRPQPRKDYRLFLGEKDIISISQKSC